MPERRSTLPKSIRLRRRAEFVKVQDEGQSISADCLLAVVLPAGHQGLRVGFTVSSKVGNAVVRNRVRRRMRELFRTRQAAFPQGLDVVLIARSSAAKAEWPAFVRAFDRVERELAKRYMR